MVEYLYNAIWAVAGQDITVNAFISDVNDEPIKTDCSLVLHDDEKELTAVKGSYLSDELGWDFTIPAEDTKGLQGRYWYCLQHKGDNLCFKQPIYLEM